MAGLLIVGIFLTTLLFNLILFVLWARIMLRYYRVSHLHPIGKSIYGLTGPVVGLVERNIYKKNARLPRHDWISLGFIVLVESIKLILLGLLRYKILLPFAYLFVFLIGDMIVQLCNLLFYALLIRVILSWVNTQWQQHPAAGILMIVTDPLIRLGRKIIPDISGFDFGPFVMMIILEVITLFVSASMPIPLI